MAQLTERIQREVHGRTQRALDELNGSWGGFEGIKGELTNRLNVGEEMRSEILRRIRLPF